MDADVPPSKLKISSEDSKAEGATTASPFPGKKEKQVAGGEKEKEASSQSWKRIQSMHCNVSNFSFLSCKWWPHIVI